MSENPFKGVPGGDPSRRAAHLKTIVNVSFICARCNQKKEENLPEGKDTTGRICVDCRNAEGVQKQKERQEALQKQRAKEARSLKNRPIRTKEEKLALIKEWSHLPRHQCCSCHKSYFEADPRMPFYNDDYDRPNAILTVIYDNDPFALEIHDEKYPNWYCRRCFNEIALDI